MFFKSIFAYSNPTPYNHFEFYQCYFFCVVCGIYRWASVSSAGRIVLSNMILFLAFEFQKISRDGLCLSLPNLSDLTRLSARNEGICVYSGSCPGRSVPSLPLPRMAGGLVGTRQRFGLEYLTAIYPLYFQSG